MKQLKDFQREDVDQIKEAGLRALIANSPGTGKTAIAIRSLAETWQQSLPAVIVCPASVVHNWAREFEMWAPDIHTVCIEDMSTALPRVGRNTAYILSWALLDSRMDELLARNVNSIVADESHFAKNSEAIRSQALAHICKTVPYGVLLLTGTPIVNNTSELQTLREYLGVENPLMIRRLLEDVVPEVPPKRRMYLNVELRPRHREIYDQAQSSFEDWLRTEKEKMLGDGMAEDEVERAMAAEALVKVGYLRRLVGEFKVPAASDWIAQAVRLGEPVVVFAEHQATIKKLSKSLRKQRIRHHILDGAAAPKDRQAMIDDFQHYRIPVFIGSKAAKEGITLTAARHLLFVERFFTAADEEQGEDRVRRIGQRNKTTIWYMQAVDTIDARLDAIVQGKRNLVRTVIGSADIMETPEGNVFELLRVWKDFTTVDEVVVPLGQGEPLPPLPGPRDVHAVLFTGSRWKPETARLWCQMHNYKIMRTEPSTSGFKIVSMSAQFFEHGKFSIHRVARDIKLIVGKRLPRPAEKQIRAIQRAR